MRLIRRISIMRVIRLIRYSRFPTTPKPAMTQRQNARIASRKLPQQARPTERLETISEIAVQVFAEEGAP
ncbi:hypothetical protein [Pseudomonas mediterranea]|uniref:hypothetical protein n=1 Tax=Pseudomonas mediterranea TaxID=183795 RepID=UPI000AEA7717|nr:hypothetical protein [Pseudomonas mediterranea]CAH0128602.1 hypothetical protein SRABI112_00145 [Pseudomonas mediterranea]